MTPNFNFQKFFQILTETNKYAKENGFIFANVSGLDGFEEALDSLQSHDAFVAFSDISQGYIEVNNTPHTRRVKTVFLAMRHPVNNMVARQICMDIMRELFRQFMSRLLIEKLKLENNNVYIDPRITFQEIDQYFFSGCACAYFQIAIDKYTDLRFNANEWS